ncbi:hypothetical protein [Paraburkholderia sp. BCC1886]|uniref:hypothetical protein n=1 Tax=Paraburkholderia sp. BCC1886 TaxID=2562670 RepID=UPI001182DBA1|nr:hypothetical protein [Paraburkholderia sp. BCC1886]
MTTASIVNGAPMTIFQGAQDLSTEVVTAVAEQIPQHLPLICLYTQQGPVTTELVSGSDLTTMYGSDSFDLRKAWGNHATVLASTVNAQGNAIQVQRMQPADAAPAATMRLYLDVLPATITQYERNSDGSFTTDSAGNKVAVTGSGATAAGYICKWVLGTVDWTANEDAGDWGEATIAAGDQSVGSVTSQRYPIMDLQVPSFGTYGNNNGIRLYAPTTQSSVAANTNFTEYDLVYPFRISCVQRTATNTTGSLVAAQSGAQYLDFTFKPKTIDLAMDDQISIQDTFIAAYQSLNQASGVADVFGPFGQLFTYDDNIATLVAMFYAAELPLINSFSDFTGATGEEWLFNFVSGVSSTNVPYSSWQLNTTDSDAAYLSSSTTLWASGGTDGTMNDTLFAELVTNFMAVYADLTNPVQDMVTSPESIFWDSGFPLATKKAICQFISQRKDTFVALSTFSTLSPVLTQAEESSMAVALKAYLQQYPESDYFGTACVRGMIVPGSGTLTGSLYAGSTDSNNSSLPLTIELASKAAAYMGASNGKWKSGYSFDSAPGSEITLFSNINVTFWPATVRNTDWANGMVGVEAFQRRSVYFPALKTVYDNDTSVLNSFFNAMALCYLEKIGDAARRYFSGTASMTDAQLIKNVNAWVTAQVSGIFDNRFTIVPNTTVAGADAQRGYSWTLTIAVYMPNMKTVETLAIQTYRSDDLTSTSTTSS